MLLDFLIVFVIDFWGVLLDFLDCLLFVGDCLSFIVLSLVLVFFVGFFLVIGRLVFVGDWSFSFFGFLDSGEFIVFGLKVLDVRVLISLDFLFFDFFFIDFLVVIK